MNPELKNAPPARALVLGAFAIVYIVWGSTYLAMRVAIETLPPFLMAGIRFLVAGSALFVWLRILGARMPGRNHCRNAFLSGFLLLVTGNGLVAWSEQTVPSGLAALLVALIPAWFALLDWFRPAGMRPQRRTLVGIVVGFVGMALLVMEPGARASGTGVNLLGVLALVVAAISWAAGSLFSKHRAQAGSPWMTAALQMLGGGVVLIVLAFFTGEFRQASWAHVSSRSVLALSYLIVFGSLVGFSAYVWLLKVSKLAHVATYAYVNPVIALFLGRILLGEPLDARILVASAVIVAGVMIILLPKNTLSLLPSNRNMSQKTPGEVPDCGARPGAFSPDA